MNGKFGKAISVVKALLRQPSLLGAVLHDNRLWQYRFRRSYGHAKPLPIIPLEVFVPDSARLREYTFMGGGSMITDLLLLQSLSRRPGITTYFEIGTWRGESLSAVCANVEKAFSLDLGAGEMNRLGFPQELQDQMGSLVSGRNNVQLLYGDSMYFDFGSVGVPMDLVFIDGKHTYRYVLSDTKNTFAHLTHENSIIVWHDYAFHPEHIRYEVYKAIMDAVPVVDHRHIYQIAHTKCAVLLRDYNGPVLSPEKILQAHGVFEVKVFRREPDNAHR